MFIHVIPLEDLKRHSATYWQPGRDDCGPADTWVVLSVRDSGYSTTFIDVPAVAGSHPHPATAEEVLAMFLSAPGESVDRARNAGR